MANEVQKSPEELALEEELKGIEAAIAVEDGQRKAAEAAAIAEASSPEAKRKEAHARLAAAQQERIAVERAIADAKAFEELKSKTGGRCRRIYTEAGELHMVAMTFQELDAMTARAQSCADAAGDDAARAESDSAMAFREGTLKSVVWPKDIADRRKILETFPGAWRDVFQARDELARGKREAAGKGGAR